MIQFRCAALRLFLTAFVALALISPAAAQRGARVLHRNLADLVSDAHTILTGRVLSVAAEPHPQFNNIWTVVITLDVQDTWKGATGRQFTFRQFVWDLRDMDSRLGYKPGQDVLLFLTRPSEYGLSSPAGLDQGRFRIVRDAGGERAAVNGYMNLGLFRDLSRNAPKLADQLSPRAARILEEGRGGPIPIADFREMVRAAASP